MAELELGWTFFDKRATNLAGQKGKYFLAFADAEYDDDRIPCFVCNTENRMDICHLGCNEKHERYVIAPETFSWVTDYTAIMLNKESWYTLEEILGDEIELKERAKETLLRQIKNCIDKDSISPAALERINSSFHSLPVAGTPPKKKK